MGKIIKIEEVPENEQIYLKKDWTGWRVVEPIQDDNGKFKWKRIILGTTKERVFLGFIILIILFGYLGYKEQLTNYYKVLDNPCIYCNSCQEQTRNFISEWKKDNYEIPNINLTQITSDG